MKQTKYRGAGDAMPELLGSLRDMSRSAAPRVAAAAVGAMALSLGALIPPASAAPAVPPGLPTSCQQVRTANPSAGDGEYTLYLSPTAPFGKATIYCRMSGGTPKEYLSLVKTGGSNNYSRIPASWGYPGPTDVVTHFTKVRLNPATLTVIIDDFTFSTTTGGNAGPSKATYGVAQGCGGSDPSARGAANIDLTGTPFRVNDTFASIPGVSWEGDGAAAFSSKDQVVNLTGGGICGGFFPTKGNVTPPTLQLGLVSSQDLNPRTR
jgi:hypothetical protein